MIKKYITLAALLSAGTALANANTWKNKSWQDTGEDVIITTTFSNINSTSATSTTTVNGNSSTYNASVSDPRFSGTTTSLKTSGNAATTHNSLVPDFDVSSSNAKWTMQLNYNLGSLFSSYNMKHYAQVGLQIESVEIKLGAVNTDGDFVGYKTGTTSSDGNMYDFTLTLTPDASFGISAINRGDQNKWVESSSKKNYTGSRGEGPQENPQIFNFMEGWTPDIFQSNVLPQNLTLAFSVGTTQNSTAGTIGIQSITLNTSLMKEVQNATPTPDSPEAPEPSAFGLLAGLGALALVASRRRRK